MNNLVLEPMILPRILQTPPLSCFNSLDLLFKGFLRRGPMLWVLEHIKQSINRGRRKRRDICRGKRQTNKIDIHIWLQKVKIQVLVAIFLNHRWFALATQQNSSINLLVLASLGFGSRRNSRSNKVRKLSKCRITTSRNNRRKNSN